MPSFTAIAETIGLLIAGVEICVIVIGLLVASARYLLSERSGLNGYKQFRHDLGKGILLGLEFLVAADIIRTVAVTPTLESVAVLALIVVVRTFLSMALQVELEGHWPNGRRRIDLLRVRRPLNEIIRRPQYNSHPTLLLG